MEPASVALKVNIIWLQATDGSFGKTELKRVSNAFFFIPGVQPGPTLICKLHLIASIPGSGNVLKVQQLLHICSEHYEAKEKEKEDDKEKKDKKDKDKKESDMGSHQVKIFFAPVVASLFLYHIDLSYL